MTTLFKHTAFVFFALILSFEVMAQPNTTIDLEKDKSEKNKDRKLAAEKTGDKKFGVTKRFFNNLYTHYNYYYNANLRLNEVIEKAKSQFTDNYTQLLPFYNYTLDATAQNAQELDSVIYKSTAGILLHDLRSDWVDDMYLILGKALMFRKDFDSAQQVFKYLNYIYAVKDDGYDIPIGSNASNTNGIFTVSTNEKDRSFFTKLTQKPIKRNDAFLWMARTYLEAGETDKATGLLMLLKSDPIFPKRLHTQMFELIALNNYQLKKYDTAAYYLTKSLANASNKKEKARWEFLAGQLYQKAGNAVDASKMYELAIKHSVDPLMEVYARLNMAGVVSKNEKQDFSKNNLDELYKLAKKERYETYRDIIYYTAGLINQKDKNYQQAIADFLKSTQTSVDNPTQKNKSFYALASAHYDFKNFVQAANFYDSTNNSGLDSTELTVINFRKPELKKIIENYKTIFQQDSLLAIAKLPTKEINAIIKKIYKQYKKDKGEKEAATNFDFGNEFGTTSSAASTTLFSNATTLKAGEFYFSNANAKQQGSKEFKAKWGNRPNVDNWNRSSVVANQITTNATNKKGSNSKGEEGFNGNSISGNAPMAMGNPDMPVNNEKKNDMDAGNLDSKQEIEITPESMYLNIPFTDDKKKVCDSLMLESYYNNGNIFTKKLEEFQAAIDVYDSLLKRFPSNKYYEEVLFNQSYCYRKLGKEAKSALAANKLKEVFGESKYLDQLQGKIVDIKEQEASTTYTSIYNSFLEGKFSEAIQAKNKADKIFGDKYWTPQLSYIEAIYYIKQNEDSTAIQRLNFIASSTNDIAFKEKALTMIDVLKRRKEIESYLTNLEIEKKEEIAEKRIDLVENEMVKTKRDTSKAEILKNETKTEFKTIDKILDKPITIVEKKGFTFKPDEEHFVAVILTKVDYMFVNEAKGAFNRFNKQKHYNLQIGISNFSLNDSTTIILQGPFENAAAALNYIDITRPQSGRIIPWITSDKYHYTLVNNSNIELIKTSKEAESYKAFIKAVFPDKF
jgi:tetratricopeptide (TPR) repeat protein